MIEAQQSNAAKKDEQGKDRFIFEWRMNEWTIFLNDWPIEFSTTLAVIDIITVITLCYSSFSYCKCHRWLSCFYAVPQKTPNKKWTTTLSLRIISTSSSPFVTSDLIRYESLSWRQIENPWVTIPGHVQLSGSFFTLLGGTDRRTDMGKKL